jgi:hypothetical protein
MKNYSKNFYDNLIYYVSLNIFQTYKNIVLNNVHSLGWLLWLCFYPIVVLYYHQWILRIHDLKTYQPPNSHIANDFNSNKRIQANGFIHHLPSFGDFTPNPWSNKWKITLK